MAAIVVCLVKKMSFPLAVNKSVAQVATSRFVSMVKKLKKRMMSSGVPAALLSSMINNWAIKANQPITAIAVKAMSSFLEYCLIII